MIYMSVCTYSRRISNFFQEYAYIEEKKEGFLLIELLFVLAGTTIMLLAYAQWYMVIHTTVVQTHELSQVLGQMQSMLEDHHKETVQNFTREPIATTFDVTYDGITLTASRFKPYYLTSKLQHQPAGHGRVISLVGAWLASKGEL